ncbi:hypothetical protein H1R20_g6582, partial [Candolleomyces eurysporus]
MSWDWGPWAPSSPTTCAVPSPATHEIVLIHKTAEKALRFAQHRGKLSVDCKGVVTSSSNFLSEVFEGPDLPNYPGNTVDPDPKPIHSLFVTAKAQHTLPAIERLGPRISPTSTIVLLQNGMGMYEELVKHVFPNPSTRPHFILGTNSHGTYLRNDLVVHAGLGSIEFGILPDIHGRDFEASLLPDGVGQLSINNITKPGDPEYERYQHLRSTVAALLLLEDLNVSWKPMTHLQLALRRKLVVNSIINPLTALMRCRNGDLLNAPTFDSVSEAVCQEASNVFAAQIHSEASEYGDEADIRRLPSMLMAASLQHETQRIAKHTGSNKSSMLSDVEKGKGTEIDYINGYLIRLGSMYNVPTPVTSNLYNLVKMREALPLDVF